ncbi:protein JINGUBANG-like [Senna tora]|uniref:Protein JINGUBANG-like n=1 Tax=Senna tora TaxID=362788 RepID=A0A834TJU5_9FABA|nr:protein JINGUBANG-like [Senna tora]
MLPSNYVHVRRHKRRLWIQHCDTTSGLALNQGLMYSASWDKSFKIWDVSDNNYRCVESVKAHEDAINVVAVSSGGTVYTASADGSIRVWEREEKVNKYRLVNALALKGGTKAMEHNGGISPVNLTVVKMEKVPIPKDHVNCDKPAMIQFFMSSSVEVSGLRIENSSS